MTNKTMILCLGLKNSGKTLFLRTLASYPKSIGTKETVPTVGTNLIHVSFKRSNHSFTIQEIGGEMQQLWPQYFDDSKAIIYVIDQSSAIDISSNFVRLMEILTHQNVKSIKPILLILNKIDLNGPSSVDDIIEALFIPEMIKSFPMNRINLIKCSCSNGQGIDEVMKWMEQLPRK
ncbi:ADP-ribosylation factor-like protein 6 [Brevipalpus obovatus]|uniref:ADP-ribosylation factor-like protein 6 n=1 Tax=Brevipalpus obovatus TaxID=246614 RepID=UPI003D9E7F9B